MSVPFYNSKKLLTIVEEHRLTWPLIVLLFVIALAEREPGWLHLQAFDNKDYYRVRCSAYEISQCIIMFIGLYRPVNTRRS